MSRKWFFSFLFMMIWFYLFSWKWGQGTIYKITLILTCVDLSDRSNIWRRKKNTNILDAFEIFNVSNNTTFYTGWCGVFLTRFSYTCRDTRRGRFSHWYIGPQRDDLQIRGSCSTEGCIFHTYMGSFWNILWCNRDLNNCSLPENLLFLRNTCCYL